VRKTVGMAAVIGLAALSLAACGERSSDNGDDTKAKSIDFKACMVSDSGGFDDKSFNQTSLQGMLDAKDDIGVQTAQVESSGDSEYADNIDQLVNEGCDQITTVGFLLGDATLAAAKANPDIDFAIVDFAYIDEKGNNTAPDNLKGLTFNTSEPSYLAGYLAAAKSESGKVGTFGGLNIPTVTIFMNGFLQGVEKYNEDNGTDVQVIGWDGKDGSFTEDFENKAKGQQVAEQEIQQGADVIFPVAGPAGLGGLQAAKDAGAKGIWVDTDGCESAAEYCDILLTSVMKGMDVAVEDAIQASVDGNFSNELYTGTLENGGVGLADYGPNADVDDELASKIDDLKQQIIDGTITIS
jgi:basic membrane protein A